MNRAELLALSAPCVKKINVPGVGKINIRLLNGRTGLDLEVAMRGVELNTADGMASLVAKQLAAFIGDEGGKPILSEEDAVELMQKLTAEQTRLIIRAGVRANALGGDQVEAAGGN